ncbi:MAG: hypothetical protein ABJD97_16750 [Betaproteobacteria bacterium]
MQIQPERMAALTAQRQSRFLDRLAGFIENKTQRAPQRAALDGLFARASGYGLVTEQQVAGYITLAAASAAHETAADPAWIAEVMADAFLTPANKVAALFDLADRFPGRRASASFPTCGTRSSACSPARRRPRR